MSRPLSSIVPGLALVLAAACSNSPTGPSAQLQTQSSTTTPTGTGTGYYGNTAPKTRLEISLVGSAAFGHAKGKAKFTAQGGQRELEIEVEELVALAGTSVDFFVGGVKVGSAVVSALGEAELDLNTRLGSTVSASVAGQAVEVRTGGGAVIATGSF
jgi:hypothetical protein